MACTYGNAICNVVALDALSSQEGFFPPESGRPGNLGGRGWVSAGISGVVLIMYYK